ncbi:hypothetical protein ACJ8PQ_08790, partial [Serratia sp. CY74664]|uniref:hypothetical protein n=1 Tax=Serratia sp. CY74664 TaxID=3383676 RepID=UPI003F9EC513
MPGLPGSAHGGTPNMNFLAVKNWGNAHSLDSRILWDLSLFLLQRSRIPPLSRPSGELFTPA